MTEELGKIEKPPASDYTGTRKLFYIPFLYSGQELPEEYREKIGRFWKQAGENIKELAERLGPLTHIYHELIANGGKDGIKLIKELDPLCYATLEPWLNDERKMEAVEDPDILSEFMDWNRCLYVGLENPRVTEQVYQSYTEAGKKRNSAIAKRINETLKDGEIGILVLRENHQVQFPTDIQVFYVAPPALDELKRWIRDYEASVQKEEEKNQS